MKYEPAARSNETLSTQLPFVQFVSVAVLLSAPAPTLGLTVTLTVVPVGTPEVENTTDADPGIGRTMSTPPNTPCGFVGTACPPTDVIATVGLRTLKIGPGPGVRAASGSVPDTGNVFVKTSMRMAPALAVGRMPWRVAPPRANMLPEPASVFASTLTAPPLPAPPADEQFVPH